MTEVILAQHFVPEPIKCGIKASNDVEAISSWLNEYQTKINTYTSYKKEAYKFLLWLESEHKILFELKKEDFAHYINWLQAPIKTAGLNASKIKDKENISTKAVHYNIRVINSLLNYLVEADYIYKNPLRLIKNINKFIHPASQALEIKARILEDVEFQAVLETLDELPEINDKERDFKAKAKLIFSMLYHLGLRINELATARWDSFKLVQGLVWFFLIGKGGKARQIPANNELHTIIKHFREYKNLPDDITLFESNYIFPSSKTKAHLSTRRIREIVKYIFNLAALKFDNKQVQAKLKNASPHDLRHLLASNLDALGISIIDTKEILGHSSEKTTEIYRNSKVSKKHASIQKNKTGMSNLFVYKESTHTELKFSVACRKQNAINFNYFINSVKNLYLKNYALVNELDLEKLRQEFLDKARLCNDLIIKFLLQDKLDELTINNLQTAIIKAAEIRGITVKIFD